MINAPALVLTVAAVSVISKGGIKNTAKTGDPQLTQPTYTLKFWAAIIGATGGILVIDNFNSRLATQLSVLLLVGAVISNSTPVSKWMTGFATGLKSN